MRGKCSVAVLEPCHAEHEYCEHSTYAYDLFLSASDFHYSNYQSKFLLNTYNAIPGSRGQDLKGSRGRHNHNASSIQLITGVEFARRN
jgi:hypothetical protein